MTAPHPPSAPSPRERGEGELPALLPLAPRERGEGGRRPGEGCVIELPRPPREPPSSTFPCGCSLSAPSVTTCSPSRTPVTTAISPSFNTTCTGRISAVLSGPTT